VFDWEGLSEFLVLICSLLELKSRFLLPGQEVGEETVDPEQAREMLLARLLTYQTYKAAALLLRSRGAEQRGRLLRAAARGRGRTLTPLEEVQARRNPADLARSVDRLLEAKKGPDTSHMPAVRVELARQIAMVRRLLETGTRFSFDRTFGREPAAVQAVTLFALLELLARGEVRVEQARPFGDITVRAREARKIA
jgi:segregation and condensation protein A